MKKDIHPPYYQTKVTCACGNTFTVGSTKKEIKVDICAACHPFFTGEQKFVDTEGRVDKFIRKQKQAAERIKEDKAKKDAKEKRKKAEKTQVQPKSLKDLLVEENPAEDSSNSAKSPSKDTEAKNQ